MKALQPQDLRIGNIVYGITEDEEDNEVKILSRVLTLDSVGDFSIWVEAIDKAGAELYEYFQGVELTEEILIKAGFTTDAYGDTWLYFQSQYLTLTQSNGLWYPAIAQVPELSSEDEQMVTLAAIEFVHSLQNLYFTLTGQELEINL